MEEILDQEGINDKILQNMKPQIQTQPNDGARILGTSINYYPISSFPISRCQQHIFDAQNIICKGVQNIKGM